ncbi:MAG: hypothetical protein ACJ75J_11870 [Cytophagaceae bacterium]
MKSIRRNLLILFSLLLLTFLFKGSIYRFLFSYRSIGQRSEYPITSRELSSQIENQIKEEKPKDVQEIISLALTISSGSLSFSSASGNPLNPNSLPPGSSTHCIGYSAYFNTVCNYLLRKYGYASVWKSTQQIGKIRFAGIDIHQFFNSAFFADHDYNIIQNSITGETLAVDPSLHDYTGIELVD